MNGMQWDPGEYLQFGDERGRAFVDLVARVPAEGPRRVVDLGCGPGKLTRLVANMEWALEDLPGVHDIVEYETRLNHVLPAYHDPVVCTYDLSRFDASVVIDIMRTHPMVIVGGILQENPFYVPPDEMLKELKERAAQKAVA